MCSISFGFYCFTFGVDVYEGSHALRQNEKMKIERFIYFKIHRTNEQGYMFDPCTKNYMNHSNHSQRQYTNYKSIHGDKPFAIYVKSSRTNNGCWSDNNFCLSIFRRNRTINSNGK